MPVYDVDGVHYDIDTTDTEVAKQKIREHLASQPPKNLAQDFAQNAPLANQAESVAGRALDLPGMLGKIIPGAENLLPQSIRAPGQKMVASGDAARAREYDQAGKGLEQLVTNPVDTVSKFANDLVDRPGETLGNIAKGIAFDPLRTLVPVAPQISNASRAVAETAAKPVRAAANTARDIRKGIDIGRIGEYEGAPSAYQPISPAALKQLSPRDQQLIKNAGGLVETQGMGAQALGENLVKNVKGNFSSVPKTAADLAFHGVPAFMTGGASLPATLAMDYLGRPLARTAMDARMGSRARLLPESQGELAIKAGGDVVGGASNRGSGTNMPVATIDTATGSVQPMDAATYRRQQFDMENAAKLEKMRRDKQLAAADQQRQQLEQLGQNLQAPRNKTPEELVNTNPRIQAIKERAQAQLPSSPKDLAIDAVTGANPAAAAGAAQEKAKQMLSPEMRTQIEARVAAQKAAQQESMRQALTSQDVPDNRGTYAPLATLNDKLAALKAQGESAVRGPEGLFEGMPDQPQGRGPTLAEIRQIDKDIADGTLGRNVDTSDMGKIYTEAQIKQLYEKYKNAKPGPGKDRLKREYDRRENARSDRGLNEGGPSDVMNMMTEDKHNLMNTLKLPDNAGALEQRAAGMSQQARNEIVRSLQAALKLDPNNKDVKAMIQLFKKYQFKPEE